MADGRSTVKISLTREIGTVFLTELVILGFFALPLYLASPLLITGMLCLLILMIYIETIRLAGPLSFKFKIAIGFAWGALYFLLGQSYVPQKIQMIAAGVIIVLLITNIYVTFGIGFQKWLLVYPVLLIPFISFLAFSKAHTQIILFTYLVVESFDSFAYLGGKLFGKTKAFPKLSPKKTVEGVLTGAVSSILIGYCSAPYLVNLSAAKLFALLPLIVVSALFGDLCASKIKRSLGVKDYGNILPMQGGVLDIYDSIIFTAPIVFIYLKLTE